MAHVRWAKTVGQELGASSRQTPPPLPAQVPSPPYTGGMSTQFTWKLPVGKGGAIRLAEKLVGGMAGLAGELLTSTPWRCP